MSYKIKNITEDSREFREHKTGKAYFLRPGEEVIIQNQIVNQRPDVFEVIDLDNIEKKSEMSEEPKNFERRKNKK